MAKSKHWFSNIFSSKEKEQLNTTDELTKQQEDLVPKNSEKINISSIQKTNNQHLNQINDVEKETTLTSTEQFEQTSSTINNQTQAESTETIQEKKGLFSNLLSGLKKTSNNIGSGLISIFTGKKIDAKLFAELEEKLLISDLGIQTTDKLIKNLTEKAKISELKDSEALYQILKDEMQQILTKVEKPLKVDQYKPFVILMIGVNGVGKTTTIGKLAKKFKNQGKSVILAAGDTFRAAAVEQLIAWGKRNEVRVVSQAIGGDSASVIYDAYKSAQANNIDILLADTAGRLQNKDNLMEELKKIVRVIKKLNPEAPHEIMIVLDASTGQNAVNQVKLFNSAIGINGITITKLDGTAKGGVIFSIADLFNIPIRYIGIGEKAEDLRDFKSQDFINALFTDNKQNVK